MRSIVVVKEGIVVLPAVVEEEPGVGVLAPAPNEKMGAALLSVFLPSLYPETVPKEKSEEEGAEIGVVVELVLVAVVAAGDEAPVEPPAAVAGDPKLNTGVEDVVEEEVEVLVVNFGGVPNENVGAVVVVLELPAADVVVGIVLASLSCASLLGVPKVNGEAVVAAEVVALAVEVLGVSVAGFPKENVGAVVLAVPVEGVAALSVVLDPKLNVVGVVDPVGLAEADEDPNEKVGVVVDEAGDPNVNPLPAAELVVGAGILIGEVEILVVAAGVVDPNEKPPVVEPVPTPAAALEVEKGAAGELKEI